MPRFNLAHKWGKINFYKLAREWVTAGYIVNFDKEILNRSSKQNRALHLFFQQLADCLTDMGIEFEYKGLINKKTFWVPYSKELVKYTIWHPLQEKMFNIKSTKDLDTEKINRILDVLILRFGEEGIEITFPNKFDAYLKEVEKNENN
jgi:hypothetical protein